MPLNVNRGDTWLLSFLEVRATGRGRISPPSARAALESYWFLGSGWEGRAEKLFTLAGEVEKKVGREP